MKGDSLRMVPLPSKRIRPNKRMHQEAFQGVAPDRKLAQQNAFDHAGLVSAKGELDLMQDNGPRTLLKRLKIFRDGQQEIDLF